MHGAIVSKQVSLVVKERGWTLIAVLVTRASNQEVLWCHRLSWLSVKASFVLVGSIVIVQRQVVVEAHPVVLLHADVVFKRV